jgi:GNAT superfamily N-acetyltransferase
MTRHSLRLAQDQDCAEIARLASQLGYPATSEAMQERLERLLRSPIDVVFVAEDGEGGWVGWMHGVLSQFLESEHRAEIGGLVVDERFQRKGIGRELVKRVEAWAREHGVTQASIRCRTTRAEAHLFYEGLGYSRAKTQIVFRKALP